MLGRNKLTGKTNRNVPTATEQLATSPIPKLLLTYAIPAIVGTMVNAMYNIVDRIFIGQGVSSMAISGLAVTFPIFTFLQAFGVLVGAGASARISMLLGQRENDRAERVLGNAFLLSIILSVSSIAFCYIFMKPLLLMFGASEVTLPYAVEYLEIALLGNIFANVCFAYNSVMRASGYPKKAMITMLIGAFLNTILDPIFIFGFKMGIRGAAIATVISMFIGMCYVLRHFMHKDSLLKIRVPYFKLNKNYIVAILSIGMAPFTIQLAGSLVSVIMNRGLSSYGGDYAVGAYGIQNSFVMIIVLLMLGMSQGMQPIVGFNYGAGQFNRMREAFKLSATTNVIIGAIGFVIAILFPELVVRAFTDDPEMISVASRAIRIVMCAMIGVGFQITTTQFFQSIGKAKKAMLLSLSRQVIFLIPLLIILPPFMGLDGIWWANPISDAVSIVLSIVLYTRYMKKLERKERETI